MNYSISKLSGVIIFLLLIILISTGCSDDKAEREKFSKETSKALLESHKKNIELKIDLLCLKHGINSEPLKKELKDYVMSKDLVMTSVDTKDVKKMIEELTKHDEIETLLKLSKKHDVNIQILAGLFYDYTIWERLESKCE